MCLRLGVAAQDPAVRRTLWASERACAEASSPVVPPGSPSAAVQAPAAVVATPTPAATPAPVRPAVPPLGRWPRLRDAARVSSGERTSHAHLRFRGTPVVERFHRDIIPARTAMVGKRRSILLPIGLWIGAVGCSNGAPPTPPPPDTAGADAATDLTSEAKSDLIAGDPGQLDAGPPGDTGSLMDAPDAPAVDTATPGDAGDGSGAVMDGRSDADSGVADRGPDRPEPPPCPAGQHDGGDGTCVARLTCVMGFTLDMIGTCARWTDASPMATPRAAHTATVLPDGRVVVTGGYREMAPTGNVTNSVEIYDPRTDTWTDGGRLLSPRAFHTATLLPSGQILVVGGTPGPSLFDRATASAELYDPRTRMSVSAGMMADARRNFTATLLHDGRVLIAGGFEPISAREYSTCALFDPGTGRWIPTGSLSRGRSSHSATLLPDGRVLVSGGQDDVTELYNPSTGGWFFGGATFSVHEQSSATLDDHGRVWITGGRFRRADRYGEYYEIASEAWRHGGAMIGQRYRQISTMTSQERIVEVAGVQQYDNMQLATNTADYISVSRGRLVTLPNLRTLRMLHTTNTLPNNQVIVIGGDNGRPSNSVEILQMGRELPVGS